MSMAMAKRLAQCDTARVAELEPDRATNVGSAVMGIVASADVVARVKERTAACDQQELMQTIDEEVDAVRASRS